MLQNGTSDKTEKQMEQKLIKVEIIPEEQDNPLKPKLESYSNNDDV